MKDGISNQLKAAVDTGVSAQSCLRYQQVASDEGVASAVQLTAYGGDEDLQRGKPAADKQCIRIGKTDHAAQNFTERATGIAYQSGRR